MPIGIYSHKPHQGFQKGDKNHSKKPENRKRLSELMKGENNPMKRLETRKKVSERMKGKIPYFAGWNKGIPMSEEIKRKILKNRKWYKHSEETKRKMSESHKGEKNHFWGRKHTKKAKEKVSIANLGKIAWNKGKKLPQFSGINNPNWQGGKSFEPYTIDWTQTLKRSIRERDHYICQLCSQYGNIVHHADYNKENCNPQNLITLCLKCHSKTNYKREYWVKFFSGLVVAKTTKNEK